MPGQHKTPNPKNGHGTTDGTGAKESHGTTDGHDTTDGHHQASSHHASPHQAGTSPDGGHGVYAISIAAELTGIEPHTLRAWENAGLLTPTRSQGGTRRYSPNDLTLARHINDLANAGLNPPGIHHVLHLEQQLHDARQEIERLNHQLDRIREASAAQAQNP